MFTFQICTAVPGQVFGGGGVVEVAGRVVWGGVYRFGEISSEWVT